MNRRAFLLGAGFSYDLGMPLAAEVTQTFLKTVTEGRARHLGEILSLQDPFGEGRPINGNAIRQGIEALLKFKSSGATNYEGFLSDLETETNRPGRSRSDRDSYHFLFGVFYEELFKILFAYQAAAFDIMYELNRPQYASLVPLTAGCPTWIFSLNHDLFVEMLAIDLGVPVSYGDSETITFPLTNAASAPRLAMTCSKRDALRIDSPHWLNAPAPGINLVRLHGGLCEHEYGDKALLCNPSLHKPSSRHLIAEAIAIQGMGYYHNGVRVPSGRMRVVTGPNGDLDILQRAVLTGGNKYSKTTDVKKGEEKLKLFSDVLEEVDEIVVIGYSFGDGHVNKRLSNAMVKNERLSLWVIDPYWHAFDPLFEQFNYRLRLRSAACRAAEWLGYMPAEKWDLRITEALKKNAPERSKVREAVHKVLRIPE